MKTYEKISAVAKLARRSPKKVFAGARHLIKHGVVGLKEKVYEEAIKSGIKDWDPLQNQPADSIGGDIKFSVVMPIYNVDPKWLKKAYDSVLEQIYSNWELILVDDCSSDSSTHNYLVELTDTANSRISIIMLDKNKGISYATNVGCAASSGDYIVFLDNDDVLTKDALLECFYAIESSHDDVLYSDQDQIDQDDIRSTPLYKPDWSPDLLNSQMYVGHLLCVNRSLFEKVGGFDTSLNGSQDYDLMLRLSENTSKIRHIPKILYSWRAIPSSTAMNPDAKPYAQHAGRQAVQNHLDRLLGPGEALVNETEHLFVYDTVYNVPEDAFASIIIPTKDHVDDLRTLITSIKTLTTNIDYEILVLNNNSELDETLEYLRELEIEGIATVINAPYPFNWSKLNNQGIHNAKGDVFVFLNNDVVINSEDWLYRLAGDALQDDIGVVGALLLYPDKTIQHAGVVVGMNGWADHVFKGMDPIHLGTPFISPMVKRNVAAVTGACMAFSRKKLEQIGEFDENFVVCGSDVEICLRALKHGLRNLYDSSVVLTHFESKTRIPDDIPSIDFELSKRAYKELKATGDPFFNPNLDLNSLIPRKAKEKKRIQGLRERSAISEIRPLHFRKSDYSAKRLNLLLPTINKQDVFGGAATALRFFKELASELEIDARIIVLDIPVEDGEIVEGLEEYSLVSPLEEHQFSHEILDMHAREDLTLAVSNNDIFISTIWWSAYCIQNEYLRWDASDLKPNPLLYLIQDYEPGFYPWSSKYMLADSTYHSPFFQIAILNSKSLQQYFLEMGYQFDESFYFDPVLNPSLKVFLDKLNGRAAKRKKILVYGRPHAERNAFEIILEALKLWVANSSLSAEWEIVSAGEDFDPIHLGSNRVLCSLGKLTLEEYAKELTESAIGISLMVSPHPSYPPLEMAAFGEKVITNNYLNKDLSSFSTNGSIVSLKGLTPYRLYRTLDKLAAEFSVTAECGKVSQSYLEGKEFPFLDELVVKLHNFQNNVR